jgi:hypothetical protein
MDIKWEIKENVTQFGSSDFWYDIADGGYIKPEKVLSNLEQIEMLTKSIRIVRSFENMLEERDLLGDF